MRHDRPASGMVPVQGRPARTWTAERHREALENLRRLEIQLQTASALDRRAEGSANHALAAMLRERAEERRRIAGIIRAHLVDADASAGSLEPGPAPVRWDRPAS